MNKNLLHKTLTVSIIAGSISGCGGGTDAGFDPKFGAEAPVTFTMPEIQASFDEESGIQEVDLLAGAMANGEPLTGNVNISDINFSVDQNYVTPQISTNTIASQTRSPFSEKDGKMLIDTNMFSDRLSTCDDTDVRGAQDDDGNNIGDGFPDNPTKVTYNIDFAVDNGFPLQAGESLPRRSLTLEINAVFDAVVGVTAQPVRVLLGQEKKLFASVIPAKACNPELTFEVADESVATIDNEGNINTVGLGETTVKVSSIDDPAQTITVALDVFSEFTISITNRDVDENGLELDFKEVPSCISAGFDVSATPAFGENLTGEYNYNWETSNNVDFPVAESLSYGFDGAGRFSTGDETLVGMQFEATVNLASGETGSTDIADVQAQSIQAQIVQNLMCEPGVSAHPAGFNSDFKLDSAGAPWRVVNGADQGGAVASSDLALSGTSVEITSSTEDFTAILQQVFNKQRNWASSTYGLGPDSIGSKYKFAVWVKLPVVPEGEVRVDHTLLPWQYEGGPSGPGFNFRRPGAGILSATLKPTTEWQLLEFTDENGNREWTVPEFWNLVTDVFLTWDVYGLPAGQTILLDEYAVIPVQ